MKKKFFQWFNKNQPYIWLATITYEGTSKVYSYYYDNDIEVMSKQNGLIITKQNELIITKLDELGEKYDKEDLRIEKLENKVDYIIGYIDDLRNKEGVNVAGDIIPLNEDGGSDVA